MTIYKVVVCPKCGLWQIITGKNLKCKKDNCRKYTKNGKFITKYSNEQPAMARAYLTGMGSGQK